MRPSQCTRAASSPNAPRLSRSARRPVRQKTGRDRPRKEAAARARRSRESWTETRAPPFSPPQLTERCLTARYSMGMLGRRQFLLAASATLAGMRRLRAQAAMQFVETPVLKIAYEESGPRQGFPVILLHGFPDDVRAFDGVLPPLVKAGHRVLVPYLRGYGPTRFRDPSTPRMGEQAAIGQDLIDFAGALDLEHFAV